MSTSRVWMQCLVLSIVSSVAVVLIYEWVNNPFSYTLLFFRIRIQHYNDVVYHIVRLFLETLLPIHWLFQFRIFQRVGQSDLSLKCTQDEWSLTCVSVARGGAGSNTIMHRNVRRNHSVIEVVHLYGRVTIVKTSEVSEWRVFYKSEWKT